MPELVFKGKEFVYNHHLTVPYRPLVPVPEKSIGEGNLDDNLIIHGDNLHALKALLPRYAGKVDCIFIDPPYNTGNESWTYNDNVNSPLMREWLSSNPVNKEDMLRHDKWCCMMWPRLRLLHELLAESGSIWITLDDNEVHRARCMLDEIFGEDHHVVTLAWQKRTSPESRKVIASAHDHVLAYSKGDKKADLKLYRPADDRDETSFSNPDDDHRGPWASSDMTAQGFRPNQMYEIETPSGEKYKPPTGRCWSLIEPEFQSLKADDRIWFGINGDARPRIKTFIRESEGLSDWSWWPHGEAGTNEASKKLINEILHLDTPFETPKPTQLVERIIALACSSKDSIVLDSFAGSGTTGHATLALNEREGATRRFILIECEDYAENVTAERIRRTINGYSYTGTHREVLYSKKLSLRMLENAASIAADATATVNAYKGSFDSIEQKLIDGVVTVFGIQKTSERVPGLSKGQFTYCELGEPLDSEAILTGETMPSWEALGAWLLHTATGASLAPAGSGPTAPKWVEPESRDGSDIEHWFLGEAGGKCVWLVYRPDVAFLKSRDAALTLDLAEQVVAARPGKAHLLFAPARFVPNSKLIPLGCEYAPLPFSLYRVERA